MNILPTIVQEVVSQCKKQGFVTSAALATFYTKCQLLTAKKDPSNNVEVTPEHIERLVANAVSGLTQTDSPQLETFKLQASVTATQQDQLNKFRTEKVQHKAKSHRLSEDIWPKRDPNEVFGDITLFILHESHLLDANNEAAQRETMAALETVFPKVHMDSFIAQRETEKTRQLEEIWRIVWGIRIFNKEIGKGGAGIPDLLADAVEILSSATTRSLKNVVELEGLAKDYSAVLLSPSLHITDSQRLRLQDEYHNRLQLLVYLRSLVETLEKLHKKMTDFEPNYKALVEETKTLVKGADGTPVPKSAIYPRFISVSEMWDTLYALHREAQDAKALLDLVVAYKTSFTPSLRERDVQQAHGAEAEERRPNRNLIATEISNNALEYLPTLSEGKKALRLEFNGFCIVSFMDGGVLLDGKKSGDTSPGFIHLHANSAYYSFSSERALKSFAKDPFAYLSQRLMETVQANAILVYLLGLHPYLPAEVYLTGSRAHARAEVLEKSDGAAQTGQLDAYKNPHYTWNEWELRRLALKLASLRVMRTKSTQTNLSHFRRDNDAQANPLKEQNTQTLVDAAVQPPRVAQYVKGLRGSATSELETVQKVFLY